MHSAGLNFTVVNAQILLIFKIETKRLFVHLSKKKRKNKKKGNEKGKKEEEGVEEGVEEE